MTLDKTTPAEAHERKVTEEMEVTSRELLYVILFTALVMLLFTALSSCVVNGPMEIAYRSVSTLQTAETEGRTSSDSSSAAVNADKTTNAQVDVDASKEAQE